MLKWTAFLINLVLFAMSWTVSSQQHLSSTTYLSASTPAGGQEPPGFFREIYRLEHDSIHDLEVLAWSPSGEYLAAGSYSGVVVVWNLRHRRVVCTFSRHTSRITEVEWSPDEDYLASSSRDGTVFLWKPLAGDEVRRLQRPDVGDPYQRPVFSLAWSPDSTHLALGSVNGVEIWDAVSGEPVLDIDAIPLGTHDWVGDVEWSHDGTLLATSNAECRVSIWDASIGEEITRLAESRYGFTCITDIELFRNKTLLLHGDSLTIRDICSNEIQGTFAHTDPILDMALAPTDELLAIAGYFTVGIWDTDTQQQLASLDTVALALEWSPDGQSIALLAPNGIISIWE